MALNEPAVSKDQQTIDQDLALGLMFFAMEASQPLDILKTVADVRGQLLGGISVILIIVAVVPAFLIAAVFIAAMFGGIGYLYLATAREVKRLESVTRSPIYALCSECQ